VTLLLAAAPLFCQNPANAVPTKEVSFQTEDGWTLYATYYVPQGSAQGQVPGLVVLSEPGWVPRNIGGNISRGVAANGMAALSVDMRGTASSFGDKDFQVFSPDERDAMQMDIRAAVKFLSSQKEIDPKRIAIFGASVTVDYVVKEASLNASQVKALVLSTGWLTDEGRERLKLLKDLPTLAIVSEDDPRKTQAASAEPFFLSEDKGSRLMFVMDRGAAIFSRPGNPIEKVTEWLKNNLRALGTDTDISFKTEDGVTLLGNLYKPDGVAPNAKVGGVVFIHGANHDATTWYHLAREVVKTGLAALIFDQRGYRKSVWQRPASAPGGNTNHIDIKAAIDFLASQSWIDSNRIGLVTATSRGGPTIQVAHKDARIRTIVGLSFYGADDNTKGYITSMDIPLFMVASTNDVNADGGSLAEWTREVHRLSNNKESELLMYDDAGRGSSMLKTKPELTGMIVRWFTEKLGGRIPAKGAAVPQ
jgi:dienelactone hydrolase